MNTLEAIFHRRSTRAYLPKQISDGDLEQILKAGSAAPVAMARYDSLHITVVQRDDLIARVFDEAEDAVFATLGVRKNLNYGAKTLIVVSSQPPHREGMDYANGGIVIENMVLAATALGIDSVIIGAPIAALAANPALVQVLGIPQGFRPVLGVVLGYSAEENAPKAHTIAVNRI